MKDVGAVTCENFYCLCQLLSLALLPFEAPRVSVAQRPRAHHHPARRRPPRHRCRRVRPAPRLRRLFRCAGGEQSARVNGHFPSGLSRRERGAGGARARSARRRARGRAREHERAAARAIAARERLARAAGAPKVIRARADAPPEALQRGRELLSIRDDGRGARGAAARTRAHPAMIRHVGRTSNRAPRPETR